MAVGWDLRADITSEAPGSALRGKHMRWLLDQVEYLSQGVPVGAVYKSTSTSINSGSGGTTYANDPHLMLEVEASEVVRLTLEVVWDASVAGDFKSKFTAPSGTTFDSTVYAYSTAPAAPLASGSTEVSLPGAGVGSTMHFRMTTTMFVGSVPGTVNWQWAQFASDAGNTTVAKGGVLEYKRMA